MMMQQPVIENTKSDEQEIDNPDVQQSIAWDDDPSNPLKWPSGKKWSNIILISMQGMVSPIASTILAIAALEIAEDFSLHDHYTLALPVGLYVLGLGLGPLVLAPCSEIYGRRIVYILRFLLFSVLNAGCALSPNITALCILRLLSGMMGSAGPSLGASSIGDMFTRAERGRAQALYAFGPTCGPVLGGILGGFIADRTGGWRWLMWVMAIASGVVFLLCALFLQETYGPYLRSQRWRNPEAIAQRRPFSPEARKLFKRSIGLPIRLLFTSPICTFMSIYLSLIYGILYLHLITILLLFGPSSVYNLHSYQWTHGTTGLAYLGAGLGSLVGTVICGKFMNQSYTSALRKQERKTGSAVPTPELRLPFMQIGMSVVPIGLIIFAWSAGRTHWIVPLLGAFIFGAEMFMGYVCIHTYLVDCFGEIAASALAAAIVTRCFITCAFCVMGFQLYSKLGYAWGTMLLAFLCIAMIPIPILLQFYGPMLRERRPKHSW
ncbi:hypothetical protein HYALB_00008706 [Hymenoscyphus albidus]|uniref:Major facilitator superfamily (MFS) profile domain-containing protein n=1 Tax=Hymenoscyphus albidus TaxID=595503 RepID=A0A9N9LLG0_9HELO|nr:hypothetical protein HYALB_00008706 [Hymenoscyphus albidus]